jgi:stress-induced morphogen
MAIKIPRGDSDPIIDRIVEALRAYETDHPRSQIDIYRQNSVSVRVRIIDPDFAGRNRVDRSNIVWRYLDGVPEEIVSDISTLILLVPEEKEMSFANYEFDDPTPSNL